MANEKKTYKDDFIKQEIMYYSLRQNQDFSGPPVSHENTVVNSTTKYFALLEEVFDPLGPDSWNIFYMPASAPGANNQYKPLIFSWTAE